MKRPQEVEQDGQVDDADEEEDGQDSLGDVGGAGGVVLIPFENGGLDELLLCVCVRALDVYECV